MSSDITAIDNFCGAGGSTTGLKNAGIRVIHAANHWDRAIESHNTNHPDVDHSCVDLSKADPRYFPRSTIAWFSPECSTHSPSGGKAKRNGQIDLFQQKRPDDPSTHRSRITAMDVIRFTEVHKYQVVIVENVVEFSDWGEVERGDMFQWWLRGMYILGYDHQIVCYNSMFGDRNPTPQSRDRLFIVFHRRGNRKPNLNFSPAAFCLEHGHVSAVQAWKQKHQHRRIGKYGKRNQYIYACPHCGIEVVPPTRPARDAIDWSLPIKKIGDRADLGLKQLSINTLNRIQSGLEKFVIPHLLHRGHWQDVGRVYSTDHPHPTQTTKQEMGLVAPPAFMAHRDYSTTPEYEPVHPLGQPSPMSAAASAKSYVAQPFIDAGRTWNIPSSVDEPTHTIMARGPQMSLIQPFIDTARTHNIPTSINEPTPAVTTGRNLSLIQPPEFMTIYHGGKERSQSLDAPSPTVATCKQFGLVQPEPFLSSYYGSGGGNSSVENPCSTVCTVQGHGLVAPDWSALIDECGYRMLQSHEAKCLQGFPRHYILLGNQEEQFKQAGNAVPPVFAEMIGRAVAESLG